MAHHSNTLSKLACFIIIVFISGCSGEPNRGALTFNNNIECILWEQSASSIKFDNAHSGNYVSKINSDNPYSTILNIRARDISDKPLKTVKVTAWFMLTSNTTEQSLVLDIRDSTNLQSIEWLNVDAASFNIVLNKWAQAELIVNLARNNRNNIDNVYRIYAVNSKNEPVYVDDFEVSFED